MTGMYLRLALDARVSIVTFGAPKPGNAAFRDAVEKYVPNTTRYVLFYRDKTGTADDFATTLPFAFMGYTHLGKEVRAQCTAKDNGKCHSMKQYLYDLPSARLETITVQQEHTNEFEGLASILSAFSGQEEK